MGNERKRARSRTKNQVFSNEKNFMETNILPRTFHHNLIQNQPKLLWQKLAHLVNFTTQSSTIVINASSITSTTKSPIKMSPIETELSCYIFIDTSVLNELLNNISSCPKCNERETSIMNNLEKKLGLPCNLVMSCNRCNWLSELYSSREIEQNNTPARKPFDIYNNKYYNNNGFSWNWKGL